MARLLGLHVSRGQLDAVEVMFASGGTNIAEGLCVKQTTVDTVAVVSAAGDAVYGVTGGKKSGVGVAVVRNGKIWMQLDEADTTITIGAPAYSTAAGKATADATTDATDNTLIGYFTSDEVGTDGVVNVPSFAENKRCAQVFIDL